MIPEEVTNLLGKKGDLMIMEVEKGAIKRYADAVGDYNPLYWDDEYAKNSRYGSTIAPPGFFGWPTRCTGVFVTFPESLVQEATATLTQAGYSRALYGGTDYEFLHPIRTGDTLEATPRISNISEKEGKAGNLIFVSVETTYTNQTGDLVAKQRHNFIHFV